MEIEKLSLQELQCGYTQDANGAYTCAVCGETFTNGEVFPVNGRYFEAPRAVALHMEMGHPDYFETLLHADTKHNNLTQNQRQLLVLFQQGTADKDIAKMLGISVSTVRHQKFMFREKAKQAKLYLAVYGLALEADAKPEDTLALVHAGAMTPDSRFVVTQSEEEQILQLAFSSLEPLRLNQFPRKAKKKAVILKKIASQFTPGTKYTEKEINEILKPIYEDYVELRRYLVDYSFMQRLADGSAYWLQD